MDQKPGSVMSLVEDLIKSLSEVTSLIAYTSRVKINLNYYNIHHEQNSKAVIILILCL